MDFLDSGLMAPTAPVELPERIYLKKKRGPRRGDAEERGLGDPLLEAAPARSVTLLGRLGRLVCLGLGPASDAEELVPSEPQPGVLDRLLKSVRRTARRWCEGIINGFLWSAQSKPYFD